MVSYLVLQLSVDSTTALLDGSFKLAFFRLFFAVVVLVPRQGHLYHLCDRSALSFRHNFPFIASSTMDIFIALHPHPSTLPFCDHHL